MKFPRIIPGLIIAVLLSFPMCSWAQTTAVPASVATEEHYPDQGFLSSTRYTNRYFGFAFDFPSGVELQPVPQLSTGDSRVQMLQVGGPPPADPVIWMTAYPILPKSGTDAKSWLRKQLDQELFIGVQELHGLSKTVLGGHQFFWYETRRGIDQHIMLAANLNSYVVAVLLGSRNDKILKQLETSFQQIEFFPPEQARAHAGKDAQDYEGPAISTRRLAQMKADPPARHVDPGKVQDGVYENGTLGFSYHLPQGWTVTDHGVVEPAMDRTDRDRERDLLFDTTSGRVEQEVRKVCDRLLFSAWAQPPGPDGAVSYDDFGEVTVSAASLACFPGLKFPANSHDRQAVKDFLLQFTVTHPIARQMSDAKAFTSGDHVFLFLHGTAALKVSDDQLTRRLSVGMSVTERNGYLLTWFFAAPHDAELRDLVEERAAFDPEPKPEVALTKPGGGAATPAISAPPAQPAAGAVTPVAQPSASGTPQASATGQSAAQPSSQTAPASTASTAPAGSNDDPASTGKPSLLRPGENMQEQQPAGKPVPKH